MRRAILGILGLLLFGGGVYGLYAAGGSDQPGGAAASVAIRAGVLLGAIWLAMPQMSRFFERFPPWMLAGSGVGALLLIWRPRLVTYVAPLFAALLAIHFAGRFLRPILGGGPERRRRPSGRDRDGSDGSRG